MRLWHSIALRSVPWLWIIIGGSALPLLIAQVAGAEQPYGGIAPYYFIVKSANGNDPAPIVRDISLEQAVGNQGLYRDVIVGYGGLNPTTGEYPASSPAVEFNIDPVLAALTPSRYGDGGKFHYRMYVYNESVVNLREGVFCSLNGGSDGVFFYNKSNLNVFGGTIRRSIRAFDESTITITGGKVKGVIAADNSVVNFTGGQLVGDTEVLALGNSRVTVGVSDQLIARAGAQDSAQLTLSDVTVVSLSGAAGESHVSLSNVIVKSGLVASGKGTIAHEGGSIAADVSASNNSHITLNQTTVAGEMSAADDAAISITTTIVAGGASALGNSTLTLTDSIIVEELAARDNGFVNLIGGQVNGLGAADKGSAAMSGGVVLTNLVAIDESNISMAGGTIAGGVGAKNHASVSLRGGLVQGTATNGEPLGLFATDFGTVDVEGTEIHNGGLAEQVAEVNLRSGRIDGDFNARGGSTAHLSGGFEITGSLEAWDNARIFVSGGKVGDVVARENADVRIDDINSPDGHGTDFLAFGNSKVFIGGGTFNNFQSHDTAGITIGGGTFEIPLVAGSSQLAIAGGTFVEGIEVEENAELSMSGGEIHSRIPILSTGDVKATQNAKVTVRGGYISDEVEAHDNSFAAITAGVIGGNMEAYDSARVSISGGTISENLVGSGNSVVAMSDGLVQLHAFFRDNSKFTFSGGKIGLGIVNETGSPLNAEAFLPNGSGSDVMPAGERELTSAIVLYDNATLNIIGNDLEAILIDPNYQGIFSLYQLSGTLADGSPIAGQYFSIQNGTGASFQLLPVPEPATAALALLSILGLPALAGRRTGKGRLSRHFGGICSRELRPLGVQQALQMVPQSV